MEGYFIYLLKSAGVLTFFVTLFAVLMQQETFHRLNRFTLLTIIILTLALPATNIGIDTPLNKIFTSHEVKSSASVETALEAIDTSGTINATKPTATKSLAPLQIATIIYFAGIFLLLIRQIIMYAGVARIIIKGEKTDASNYTKERIILLTSKENIKPFSWFRWVVINSNDLRESGREIITHEATHARQHHSLDILLADALIIIQWFNPIAWFTKNCLKNIHEFEADAAVIKSGVDAESYQRLIIKKAVGARLYSIANSFNHSSTINRITMMCKEKSNKWRCTKALYIIPVATIATLLFSQPESANAVEQPSNGEVSNFIADSQKERSIISSASKAEISLKTATTKADTAKTYKFDTPVYQVVEKMPEYPGGQQELFKFLQKNIRYPKEARDANIQGRSVVSFVVWNDGSIGDVNIVKSSGNAALDSEAIRVIKSMPRWEPGRQKGEAVNTQFTIPIMFALSTPKKEEESPSPLLIINGSPYEGSVDIINNFKEEDIESLTVVQKEEAIKQFGEKGQNGAIIIELNKKVPLNQQIFRDKRSTTSPQEL